jgi:hypothetical protein
LFDVFQALYSRANAGQQRALTLLHPHSKLVLQEAIKSDSEFLSKSNIMDYSLLLGIDAEKKQIACGLVDTIGELATDANQRTSASFSNASWGRELHFRQDVGV